MSEYTRWLIECAEDVIKEMQAQGIGKQWRKLDKLIDAIDLVRKNEDE